jgi:threonylcarbamoyladenosine tRNA methylthiotransferase MtaB
MTHKTFRVITLGCKVNQYESACLEERLKEAGWADAEKDGRADLVVVNTCIVTHRASYQSRQAIRKAIRDNPGCTAAAVGCYSQVFPDELSGIEGIDIIAGNSDKLRLPEILRQNSQKCGGCLNSNDLPIIGTFDFIPARGLSDRTRASLKIQDGCNSFCSYCIVPFARGPLKSLDPSKVIESLYALCEEGYKEAVLTGIHLSKYGVDLGNGKTLKDLLVRIDNERMPLRIRLSSLEPNEIDRELVEMIGSYAWLCRHLHIPLQSGDNAILKKMNRHYTSEDFAALVKRLYEKTPLTAIGLDVIVGFPGEDDNAYSNTFSLISNLPVSYLHVFPFSPRKGTAAAEFPDQVDHKVIKDRAADLRELGKNKREIFNRSCIGKEFPVITKGRSSVNKDMIEGVSDNYLNIRFPSSGLLKNSLVNVRVLEAGSDWVRGKSLDD